jgi:hypothetical protein
MLAANFDGVAKALGGDHRRIRIVALDERFGGGGGAVHEM